MEREQLKGLQAAVLAYAIWGLLTVYWKQLSGLNPFEMIGWRIVLAAAMLVPFCIVTNRWADVKTALGDSTLRPRLALAGILLIGNWTSYVWAVVNDRVIETALGYFLAPLTTMLLGAFLYKEGLTPLKRLAVVCTVIAVVVLTIAAGTVPWIAIIIAASWSTYGVTKKTVPLGPFTSLTSELLIILIPAMAIVVWGFFRGTGIAAEATAIQWPLLLGTGLITVTPLTLFAFAAPRVPFTILGPANFLVPIINFGLGWLVYDEQLGASRFIGFGFVWMALILTTYDTLRHERSPRLLAPVRASPD